MNNRHDKRHPQKGNHSVSVSESVWNYPVPPPEVFEKYSDDIRKVFLDEWQKQAAHRRETESVLTKSKAKDVDAAVYSIKSERRYNMLGLLFSFLLTAGFGGSAIYLLIIGKPIDSLGAFLATLCWFWILKPKNK
jgi:hypothetical protein